MTVFNSHFKNLDYKVWNNFFPLEASISMSRLAKACFLLIVSLSLLSCATGTQQGVNRGDDMERLLSEAGFVKYPADTPEKLDRLMSEVQRRVIPVQEEEQTYYLYADAIFCRCLYIGDDAALNNFERFIDRRNMERNSCIDDRMRSVQEEPWREFGELGELCGDRP